jgi:thymidylate synthase ThyX
MTISAEILLDSWSHSGYRLTTFKLKYPRYIHSEVMTHRVFSRNASSSRAIPIERMIQDVINDPVVPIFMENKKGMSADVRMTDYKEETAYVDWYQAKLEVIKYVQSLSSQGVHKQIANRLLEPFSHISVVLSGTEFNNFFKQRISPNAQQEICELATKMREAMDNSVPIRKKWDEWHIPFLTDQDSNLDINEKIKVSVARCARVSYNNFSNERNIDDDLRLYNSLVKESHMSPLEHVASSSSCEFDWDNLKGWKTQRRIVEENK